MNMDWSYVAGFFDGEGCVTCMLATRRNKTHRNWYPAARCSMANTDKSVLENIQASFSLGTIQPLILNNHTPQGETKSKKRAGWTLMICKQSDIIRFVDNIYPYSVIKKKQLALLREAVLFIQNNNREKWSKEKIEEYLKRFVEENAKLNGTTRGRKRAVERVFS